jgi:hypothetical protein
MMDNITIDSLNINKEKEKETEQGISRECREIENLK